MPTKGEKDDPQAFKAAVKSFVTIMKRVKSWRDDSESLKAWKKQHSKAKEAYKVYEDEKNKGGLARLKMKNLEMDSQVSFTKTMKAAEKHALEEKPPGHLSEEDKLKFRVASAVQIIKAYEEKTSRSANPKKKAKIPIDFVTLVAELPNEQGNQNIIPLPEQKNIKEFFFHAGDKELSDIVETKKENKIVEAGILI